MMRWEERGKKERKRKLFSTDNLPSCEFEDCDLYFDTTT
jgi:hypothetical protein